MRERQLPEALPFPTGSCTARAVARGRDLLLSPMRQGTIRADAAAADGCRSGGVVTLPQRFWVKVEKTDTCWLWTAATTGGYGVFHVGGRTGRMHRAHRLAYESLVGPIPEGLQLDHLCRVRNCVNPAHLEAVLREVNILRGESDPANRARQTHCVAGHPFDRENTAYIQQAGRLFRRCRICNRDRVRRYRQQAAS